MTVYFPIAYWSIPTDDLCLCAVKAREQLVGRARLLIACKLISLIVARSHLIVSFCFFGMSRWLNFIVL